MKKFRISLLYYRSMLPACLFVTAAALFWLHLWEAEGPKSRVATAVLN